MSKVVVPSSKLEYLNSCHELVKTRLELEQLAPASQNRIMGIMKWHIELQRFADNFEEETPQTTHATSEQEDAWFGLYKHSSKADSEYSDSTIIKAITNENQLFGASVLEASKSIQTMLGSDINAMNLSEWLIHVHPSDIDYVLKVQDEFGARMLPFEAEYRYFNSDLNSWRVLRCSSYPVLKTTRENSYTQGIMVDVTDIRRAQQGLIDPIENPFPINVEL